MSPRRRRDAVAREHHGASRRIAFPFSRRASASYHDARNALYAHAYVTFRGAAAGAFPLPICVGVPSRRARMRARALAFSVSLSISLFLSCLLSTARRDETGTPARVPSETIVIHKVSRRFLRRDADAPLHATKPVDFGVRRATDFRVAHPRRYCAIQRRRVSSSKT